MNLFKLKTFQVLAEELNYTQAAHRLNYSQSTVTKHIQSLEKELKLSLVHRSPEGIALTRAGLELYHSSINIFKELDSIQRLNNENDVQRQLILHGHDYYLSKYFLPAVQKLTVGFPHVKFKMQASNNERTIENLYKGEIDLGIISGKLLPGNFKSTIIGYENVVICINKKLYHPEYTLEDYLAKYPVIVDESEFYKTENIFPFLKQKYTIIDSDSDELVEKALLSQNMIGVVRHGRLLEYIQDGTLKIIETVVNNDPVFLIMDKANENSGLHFAMFDIIVELAKPRSQDVIKWK